MGRARRYRGGPGPLGEALARTICNRFGLVSLVARTETPRLTRRAPATCPLPRPASRWPPELTEGAREERGGVLLEFKFKETIRTCLNQTGAKVSLNWTRAIFYPSRIAWRGGLFGGGPDPAPWTATHVLARRRSRLPPHGRAVAFPFRLLPERHHQYYCGFAKILACRIAQFACK